jgi:hypothetical protein
VIDRFHRTRVCQIDGSERAHTLSGTCLCQNIKKLLLLITEYFFASLIAPLLKRKKDKAKKLFKIENEKLHSLGKQINNFCGIANWWRPRQQRRSFD